MNKIALNHGKNLMGKCKQWANKGLKTTLMQSAP